MLIGVPKEVMSGEKRVAVTPATCVALILLGYEVQIETDAGLHAGYTNLDDENCGATIVSKPKALWQSSQVIVKLREPHVHPALEQHESGLLNEGGTLISLVEPARNAKLLERLASRKATVIAIDAVPRISRAQKLDARSSMATFAGYRGNCELTVPRETVAVHGVSILGLTDLPSRMSTQASDLFANNILSLIEEVTHSDGELAKVVINLDDEIHRAATEVHAGCGTWPPPRIEAPIPVSSMHTKNDPEVDKARDFAARCGHSSITAMVFGSLALYGIGAYAPPSFMAHFTVFVLACFVGWQVIWNVKPALNTSLMSVTNAISGIVILGPLALGSNTSMAMVWLATAATAVAAVNIAGGFVVTQRMLNMFKRGA